MGYILNSAYRSSRAISFQNGILRSINKASRNNEDPLAISYGITACNTTALGGNLFAGRSSGSASDIYNAYMSTIGETIERYCPSLYRTDNMQIASYKSLDENAIPPSEFALYSPEQISVFRSHNYNIEIFDEDTEVFWDKCVDLSTGKTVLCPSTFIYLPWDRDPKPIFYGVSTGLAAHSNFYKSVLTSLYEVIERDSFVLTWFQEIVPPKIFLTEEISSYIASLFPVSYQWHLFDITYDLEVPTIFGICVGSSDFGDFVAVGTATRQTKCKALKKVVQEIAQTIPYFRYVLTKDKTVPSNDFSELRNFEQHSVFYLKRPEMRNVFKPWLDAEPSSFVNMNEKRNISVQDEISEIVARLNSKSYSVLLKDLTTVDALQCGMCCTRVVVPQLLQMTGAYSFYPLGGKRLYEVPAACGYESHDFQHLNKFPHPFP